MVQTDFDRVFRVRNPLTASTNGTQDSEKGVDVLIHPTAPTLPPTLEAVRKQTALETYTNDVFAVPASLAGLPAVSVPVPCIDWDGVDRVCGMQVVGQYGSDELVLQVAHMIESYVAEGRIMAAVRELYEPTSCDRPPRNR